LPSSSDNMVPSFRSPMFLSQGPFALAVRSTVFCLFYSLFSSYYESSTFLKKDEMVFRAPLCQATSITDTPSTGRSVPFWISVIVPGGKLSLIFLTYSYPPGSKEDISAPAPSPRLSDPISEAILPVVYYAGDCPCAVRKDLFSLLLRMSISRSRGTLLDPRITTMLRVSRFPPFLF